MIQNSKLFTVSPAPHWHVGRTSDEVIRSRVFALFPAVVMGIVVFGLPALRIIALSCGTSVVAEIVVRRLMRRKLIIEDGSALLDGLILAFLLPISAPWWMVSIGAVITVYIGKQVFGGVGSNPLSAPLVGWAILKVSWPGLMCFDQAMLSEAARYPLSTIKMLSFGEPVASATGAYDYLSLFFGSQMGPIGGTQIMAIMAGGIYLIARGYIKPHIPAGFLFSFVITSMVVRSIDPASYADPLFHVMTGTAIFGAFFLATDFGATPVNRTAMVLYGVTAGALSVIIRTWGIYPDAVPFGIMLASLVAPLFDLIRPKAFGKV